MSLKQQEAHNYLQQVWILWMEPGVSTPNEVGKWTPSLTSLHNFPIHAGISITLPKTNIALKNDGFQ